MGKLGTATAPDGLRANSFNRKCSSTFTCAFRVALFLENNELFTMFYVMHMRCEHYIIRIIQVCYSLLVKPHLLSSRKKPCTNPAHPGRYCSWKRNKREGARGRNPTRIIFNASIDDPTSPTSFGAKTFSIFPSFLSIDERLRA